MRHQRVTLPAASVCLAAALVATTLGGCVVGERHTGVSNTWRTQKSCQVVVGQSTERDVLCALGPPSQIVPLHNRTVFYYLLEKAETKTGILIIYNQVEAKVAYDRAVFFFDQNGILTDAAYSPECFEYMDMSPDKAKCRRP